MNMDGIDWLIVLAFFLILAGVGFYTKRYMRGVADFLAAGRGMRKYLGFAAGGAADMGAISIVAAMQAIYNGGPSVMFIGLLSLISGIIVGKTGFVVRRYRETRILTTPQLYEMRYSKGVRVTGGAVCALSGIINMGIFPIVAGRFFVHFTGFPPAFTLFGISLPTVPILTGALIGIAIALALLGGQITVVVTDFIQALLMSIMFIAIGVCMYRIIQWNSVSEALMTSDKTEMLLNPFSKSGEFGLAYLIFCVISSLHGVGTWAPGMQKISSAASPRDARLIMLLYNLRICANSGLFYCGLAAFAVIALPKFDYLGVRELAAKIAQPDIRTQMIAPILLGKILPLGIMGMMFAAVMAAFISTGDSYLLTWAGIIVQDVIYPLRKKPLPRKQHIKLLRIVVILVGICVYLFGIFYKPGESIVIFQLLSGSIYGAGAGTIIIFGLYWRRGTAAGAYCALVLGAIIPIVNVILSRTVEHYPLQGITGGIIAIFASIVGYVVVSLLTKNPHFNLEKMLNRPPKQKR